MQVYPALLKARGRVLLVIAVNDVPVNYQPPDKKKIRNKQTSEKLPKEADITNNAFFFFHQTSVLNLDIHEKQKVTKFRFSIVREMLIKRQTLVSLSNPIVLCK